MTLPTSTEPMYLISESELKTLTHYNWMEYWDRIRARGPVVAQQTALQMCDSFLDEIHDILKLDNDKVTDALVELYNLGLLWKERPDVKVSSGVARPAPAMAVGESRFACPFQTGCEDGEGFCEYPCEKWLDWHDATLIAQEREKWERERAEAHRTYESCHKHFSCPDGEECWYSSADYYWDCGNGAARVFEAVQKAKAQAREDVLDELAQMYANVPEQFLEGTYRLHSEWREKIESLRSGQKQERDPE